MTKIVSMQERKRHITQKVNKKNAYKDIPGYDKMNAQERNNIKSHRQLAQREGNRA